MQLLFHLCVAASHWPIGMHRRHQATRPCPLTRFHERTLSFFHELRVAHWLHGPTSHFFVLCSSECAALRCRLLWSRTTTITTNITNIDNNIDSNNKNSRCGGALSFLA